MSRGESPRDWMHDALRAKLSCSKSVIELTSHDGIAMWWWADVDFNNYIKRASETYLVEQQTRASRLRKDGEPEAILLRIRDRIRYVIRTSILTNMAVILLVRIILAFHRKRVKSRGSTVLPKIVFTSEDVEWRTIRDESTRCLRKSDAFFDSILTRLSGKCECIGVYPILRRGTLRRVLQSLRIVVDKARNWNIPHRPFELYWSLQTRRAERDAHRHFNEVWSGLARDPEFQMLCANANSKIGARIFPRFEHYFGVVFPLAVQYIQMAEQMIEAEKPDLLLLEEEYGTPFELALVAAAKKRKIPALAVQHGDIHPRYSFGYVHRGDILQDGSATSPFYPIADRTAVYGSYYERLLNQSGGYPKGSLVVTGQPRYDSLFRTPKIYSRVAFLSRYGIRPEHKIVLWTTGNWPLDEEESYLKALTEAMQPLRNVTLFVKQHPGEGKVYTKMIKRHLGHYQGSAVVTPTRSDTYEQLFVCDLMITKYSTTALEAVALGKPVIILDLDSPGSPLGSELIEEGVAVGVCEKSDLRSSIQKLLNDDSDLARNRERFVKDRLYKLDGKASDRIVRQIEEMTRQVRVASTEATRPRHR